jgi:hypothetical protein
MAQSWAATWHPFIGFGLLIKILCSQPDSNRGPPLWPIFNKVSTNQCAMLWFLTTICCHIYLNLNIVVNGGGRARAIPDPRFYVFIYDHVL